MQKTTSFLAHRAAGAFATLGCVTATATALLLPGPANLHAAPVFAAQGYSGSVYYQDSSVDQIVSFDWGSDGALYYNTATNFNDGGVYRTIGGNTTTISAANGAMFNGASVVSSGNFIYFNNNDFSGTYIHRYGPVNGSPSGPSQISNAPNYAMTAHNGGLFISGSPVFGNNAIYYTPLNSDGSFGSSPPVSLGVTGGYSGPMSFDAAGNLYYAPGYGDLSIYMWTAQELAEAIANPSQDPLSLSGHEWLDYGLFDEYDNLSGVTSMMFGPGGELWATITDFSNPSVLARFDLDELGAFSGDYETILSTTGRLGDLREHNGQYYLAADDTIYQINLPVPEPGAAPLLVLALGAGWTLRRRRQ